MSALAAPAGRDRDGTGRSASPPSPARCPKPGVRRSASRRCGYSRESACRRSWSRRRRAGRCRPRSRDGCRTAGSAAASSARRRRRRSCRPVRQRRSLKANRADRSCEPKSRLSHASPLRRDANCPMAGNQEQSLSWLPRPCAGPGFRPAPRQLAASIRHPRESGGPEPQRVACPLTPPNMPPACSGQASGGRLAGVKPAYAGMTVKPVRR